VIIKGNKHGIVVVLDENMDFGELKGLIKEKFESSSKFFGNADMAVSFEGRKLSSDEEKEILNIIAEVTELNIICIIDNDEDNDKRFENAIKQKLNTKDSSEGQFYKGTLRSGQVLEAESSIIILGDVNPGGRVIASGNVIILGSLRGNIFAGANGNENAFVVALEMNPMQIKIGDIIARSSDGNMPKGKVKGIQPKIAYVDDSNIYIENLDQDVLEDIRIN
jgi:septum site-determining protein MinC